MKQNFLFKYSSYIGSYNCLTIWFLIIFNGREDARDNTTKKQQKENIDDFKRDIWRKHEDPDKEKY